ncbi:hypothetical protein C84B14_07550 [Salinisphaera sp. C84B14]|uniref:FAD-dependent oxidoreductase n=1 Tax=Salinisphaera sp. C84B14 TaxID=1304155 RepID=UPI00333F83F5
MYDWLIIGGGMHGAFAAQAITAAGPAARLAVLDDRPALADWQRRADACGMTYLRSSNAHHLGRRADALRAFAAANGFDSGHELGYYRRPSRALFEAHARHALAGPARIATRGQRIERMPQGWRVHATNGQIYDTRRLVLALGPNAPYRPVGAADCEHVYDAGFAIDRYASARLAVVGGGITGAQLALRLQQLGHTVCWVTRTPPRRADFDSEPCYAGPRCLAPFARTPIEARTAVLAEARQPGTLPPDIFARITAALAAGDIAWRRGDLESTDTNGLLLADGRRIDADRVILATGFENHARPDSLLGHTLDALELRCDSDGHVFINDDLEAAPGLHVLGRPASLQLGPMAGNIKGARLAGTRLAGLAKRGTRNAA